MEVSKSSTVTLPFLLRRALYGHDTNDFSPLYASLPASCPAPLRNAEKNISTGANRMTTQGKSPCLSRINDGRTEPCMPSLRATSSTSATYWDDASISNKMSMFSSCLLEFMLMTYNLFQFQHVTRRARYIKAYSKSDSVTRTRQGPRRGSAIQKNCTLVYSHARVPEMLGCNRLAEEAGFDGFGDAGTHIFPNSRIDLRLREGRTPMVRQRDHGNPSFPRPPPLRNAPSHVGAGPKSLFQK